MIDVLLKAIVLAIILFVVYYLVGIIVSAFGLPTVVTLVIAVLLALGFIIWLLKAFNINF